MVAKVGGFFCFFFRRPILIVGRDFVRLLVSFLYMNIADRTQLGSVAFPTCITQAGTVLSSPSGIPFFPSLSAFLSKLACPPFRCRAELRLGQ